MRRCGFRTARGTLCRRKGKGEGFLCYAHRQPSATPGAAAPVEGLPLDACPVCCDDVYAVNDAQLICRHPIHLECAAILWRTECPICRRELTAPEGRLTQAHLNEIEIRQADAGNEARRRQINDDLAQAQIIESHTASQDHLLPLREELVETLEGIFPQVREEAQAIILVLLQRIREEHVF